MFVLMGVAIAVPDHTTLSRRGQHLDVELRPVPLGEAIIVDSTGLSIVGEGEWAAAKQGGKGKRGWKKLPLGVDESGAIVAQVLTDGDAEDGKTGLDLIAGSRATFRASRRTLPTTRSQSTTPPRPEAPRSSFHRHGRRRPRHEGDDRSIGAARSRG